MQTLTDIRIYTGIMRREGDDLSLTGVKVVSDEWIHVYADDDSINMVRVPIGAVCECEPQPIPEPTPRCDNSGTNVLATLLRGADGKGVSGGYFEDDGTLILVMEDGSKVSVGRIDLSNYYTKKEVDGKKLPNPSGLNYSFNGTSSTYDGSMSKYLPSIYAPSSAGKKGQILSSNGAGAPVWVDTTSLSGVEVKWEDVQKKPTTIKGFGITDAYTKSEVDGKKLPNPSGLNYSFNGTSSTYDGSMSKYLPSIYAPSSAGKKGQILSSNGAGAPVWVDTTSLSGVEVKWEDVQKKPTTIKGFGITDAYTKSEVDGKLDDKVGRDEAIEFAKDLTGVLEATPEEFVFRASAGSKSIREESAVIRRIKGNTSVWAQHADNPIFANGTSKWNRINTTLSIDTDGSLKVKHDIDGSQGFSQLFDDRYIPSGHKVLVVIDYKRSASTSKDLLVYLRRSSLTGFDIGRITVSSSSRRTDGIIITTTEPSVFVNIYPFIGGAVEDYTNVYSVNIFDLTAIFGTGNEPTTLEEFKKTYPESYYPYCAPEVRSMRATGIETIGANAFNKDSVVGGLINADGTVTSNDIYSVAKIEVVPNEVYTLTNVANAANTTYTYALYDSDDRFISVGEIKNSVTKPISVSGDVTMPMNARYIRVVVHNDYLDSCCVNLKHTGTITTEEATYFKEVRMLPDIATYFPDGMHGIGGVFDEINEESAVKRLGVVDLGTLEWTEYTLNELQYWWATIGDIKMLGIEYFPNMTCSKLSAQTLSNVFTGEFDNSIAPHNSLPRVYARSSAYTDAASFKAAMSGVMLAYELAEPIVTPIAEPLQLDYKVADFGTEKMLHDLPSSAFRADIVYQFNAEGRIRDNARNIERLEDTVADLPKKEEVVGKDDTINANMISELAYAAKGVAANTPIVANRIPQLRADAFAFLQPDEFTIERALDGETWETLDSSTQMHRRLFTQENFYTGIDIHPSNGSWAVGSKIRITMYPKNARNAHVDFIAINMYCNGRAFDISGEYCAKNDDAPEWQDMLRTASINDNGVVYLQYSNKFGFAAYNRWGIRLTFTITRNTAYGSKILGVSGFGNRVSEVSPSVSNAPYTLGALWYWDYLKNITFPNGITANSLRISSGTTSTLLQGDGTPVSKTSIDFDVTQPAFVGPNNAWRSNGVWPILASQIDVYRANRLAFLQDDEYEVETSTDGGATWATSVKDDAMRRVFIGLNNGRIAIPSTTTDMMRITIKPKSTRYSSINFFYMWVGCPSEGNTFAKIEYSTATAPDTWNLHSTAAISGLTGPNMMKYQRLFGSGSSVANVRFTIYNTVDHTIGTSVHGIQGHGSNAWGNINNMYQFGHLYSWDVSQNAKFPAKVVASSFEDSNGNAVMLTKDIPTEVATATQLEEYTVTDGSQRLYPNIMYEYPLGIGQAGVFVMPNIVQVANSTYDNRWMLRLPSIAISSILSYPYTIAWKDGVAPTFSEPCALEIYLKVSNSGQILGEWKIYREVWI